MQKIIIALGGNAIQPSNDRDSYQDQLDSVKETMSYLLPLVEDPEKSLIITHGNGPQVGSLILQQENAGDATPQPLHSLVAMTQGQIGYLISQVLTNLGHRAVVVPTQVVVDESDKAFQDPTKPVGKFYFEAEAKELEAQGFQMKEDAGRGFRRVVASPNPTRIVELEAIKAVFDNGYIPIAVGGGGVPVVERDGDLVGIDAVIDKDKASALLAGNLNADLLIILTAVDEVYINFGKPEQTALNKISVAEAKQHLEAGQFASGSMKPKIEAGITFLEQNKAGKVLITSAQKLTTALAGDAGTWISN